MNEAATMRWILGADIDELVAQQYPLEAALGDDESYIEFAHRLIDKRKRRRKRRPSHEYPLAA